MPQVAIAVVAAVAASAAGYAAVAAAGLALTTLTGALVFAGVSAVVGAVITYGLSAAFGLTGKQSMPSLAQDRKQAVRSGIAPRRVVYGRALASGPVVYMGSSGPRSEIMHVVVCLAGHVTDGWEAVRLNDHWITPDQCDQPYGGNVVSGHFAGRVVFHFYDGTQTEADPGLVAAMPGEWTEQHKLLGITYIVLSASFDQDVFPHGFQNIAVQLRGKKVYDPRTGLTAWSDNPALCVRDYLVSDEGLACAADEIDESHFVSAANISDETVVVNNGTGETQKRYALNGSFTLDQAPIAVMEQMLTSCDGTLTYVAGRYRLHAGAYDVPSITLTEADIAGPITVQPRTPRKDLFNAVRGTYISPNHTWSATEFPQVLVPAYEAEDGERIFRDLELPWTIDSTMAQRLARQGLLRARDPLTFTAPLKYSALRLAVWDTVSVSLEALGWESKVFRVTAWKLDPTTGLIEATFREDEAANYSWTALDALPPIDTPDSTLVNPLDIPAPTGLTVTPTTAINADGAVVPALLIEWTASAHPFVTAYEIQWRVAGGGSGSTDWNTHWVPAGTTRWALSPVVSGVGYEVRVRAHAGFVRSEWTGTGTATGQVDTTAPGIPTAFNATAIMGGVSLRWTLPPDLDLAAIEIYESPTSSTASRTFLAETRASGYRHELPGGTTRHYWVRARDRSGNVSDYSNRVSATAGYVGTADLADNIINTAKFAAGIRPVGVPAVAADLAAHRATGGMAMPQVQLVDPVTGQTLKAGVLYKWSGSAWAAAVDAVDLTGQLTDAQIADLAIGPEKLAAGAVTTSKLAVGSTNVIWNSCATLDNQGWNVWGWGPGSWGGVPMEVRSARGIGLLDWTLPGYGTGYLHTTIALAPGQGLASDWRPDPLVMGVPAQPGEKWQAAAMLGAHRCVGRVEVIFSAADGTQVGSAAGNAVDASKPGGKTLAAYGRSAALGVAPAGTAYATLRLVLEGNGGADPYLFFTQALLSRAPVNATEVGEWTPGGVTEISGGQIRSRTIQADRIAANAITANELAANSVVAGKIAAGAVSADQIAAGQIKAAHIASEAVITSAAQIGSAVIASAHIQDLSVGTIKIGDGAVSTAAAGSWAGPASNVPTWSHLVAVTVGDPVYAGRYVVQISALGRAESVESSGGGEGESSTTNKGWYGLRLFINGGLHFEKQMYSTGTLAHGIVVTLPPGMHSFALHGACGSDGAAGTLAPNFLESAYLNVTMLKR